MLQSLLPRAHEKFRALPLLGSAADGLWIVAEDTHLELTVENKVKQMPQVIRERAGRVPRPAIAGHGAKFSRKQEEAVAALVAQPNVEEAARAACGMAPGRGSQPHGA